MRNAPKGKDKTVVVADIAGDRRGEESNQEVYTQAEQLRQEKELKALHVLKTQLARVLRAPCLARVCVGKVSPTRIQTPGAQVVA